MRDGHQIKASPISSPQRQVEVKMASRDLIIDILLEASRLLQGNGWNRFSMARDVNGRRCGPNSSEASCYCLSGALVKAWRMLDPAHEVFYFKFFENKFSEILRSKYNYNYTYTRWNDQVATSKEDVLLLIDGVISSILGSTAAIELEGNTLIADERLPATLTFGPSPQPAPLA